MPTLTMSRLIDSIAIDLATLGYYLEGTEGADIIYGSAGADYIDGKGGNDKLSGGNGDDQIFGGAGNDTLFGGAGNDILDGGTGNDTMNGGGGADKLTGGAGKDVVTYTNAASAIALDLSAGGTLGDASGDTFSGIERVVGSNFSDTIVGDSGSNTLEGGVGDDALRGGAGLDFLKGGDGWDTLEGGDGVDFLFGGGGQDSFKLALDGNVDVVADFVKGEDKIDASALGATFRANYTPRLSYQEGTEIPTTVTFNRDNTYYSVGNYVNKLFFDTDDHQLYVLDPIVQGYGRYAHVVGFDTIRVAAIDGADSFTPFFGFGLI